MEKEKASGTKHVDMFPHATVVYVTDQFQCEVLIQAGRKIADQYKTNLYVVNVNKQDPSIRATDLEALEFLYQVSRKNQAVMNVFYETDVIAVLRKTAKDYSATHIVTGVPEGRSSVLNDFWNSQNQTMFHMVSPVGKIEVVHTAGQKKEKKRILVREGRI